MDWALVIRTKSLDYNKQQNLRVLYEELVVFYRMELKTLNCIRFTFAQEALTNNSKQQQIKTTNNNKKVFDDELVDYYCMGHALPIYIWARGNFASLRLQPLGSPIKSPGVTPRN